MVLVDPVLRNDEINIIVITIIVSIHVNTVSAWGTVTLNNVNLIFCVCRSCHCFVIWVPCVSKMF